MAYEKYMRSDKKKARAKVAQFDQHYFNFRQYSKFRIKIFSLQS